MTVGGSPEAFRPGVFQAATHLFSVAMNGTPVAAVERLYPDELEIALRYLIESWRLGDLLKLTRDGPTIQLERVDDGPRGGWPEPES